MTCDQAREMISARIDGELDANSGPTLDAHTDSCTACTSYEHDAFALRRSLRLRAVEPESVEKPVVDLTGSLKGLGALRVTLFVIGGTLVVLNMTSILSPDGGVAAHLSRHDGIFGTALGIGMLAVAAKPHRAIGLVPLTSTIAVLMTVAAIADLLSGNANLLAEAVHVVEFAGLLCLWVISGGPSRLPSRVSAVAARLPNAAPARTLSRLRPHPESAT